jgi:hypothetical protein
MWRPKADSEPSRGGWLFLAERETAQEKALDLFIPSQALLPDERTRLL